ncbi:MAG TPA: PQQ-dependent sugar dehydrogenase, partial [Candidatus Polarisedimenticolia bacterium]|nr:PQQ-dependent sugar dehydrogenase [Candidatus Polarisedimenticolia bacterium]
MTPHRRLVVVLLLTLTPAAAAGASTVPPGFTDSRVVGPDPDTGVTVPVALAFHPGTGEPWVAEKGQGTSPSSARIRRVDPAAGTAATVMTLECVDSRGERGVLNLAFEPHDPDAAYLYLFYTRRFESSGACFLSGRPAGSRNIVSRIPLNGAAGPAPELMEIVLEGPSLSSQSEIHNGGGLAFLPDGTLLASMGDAGLDPFNQPVSRDPGDLRGKVLRIRPDGTIPGDNPLIGKAGARPEIYAMGFRNPFRLSVDPQDGIALAADVGESSWEEIDLLLPGADYGWPCREASATFVNCMPAPPQGSLVDPVFAYSHSSVSPPVSGRSVTGGPFYTATAFPAEYHGSYFFADYVRGWIRRARVGPGGAFDQVEQFASGVEGPVDLKVGPDGCLYYAAIIGSEVRRACYAGGDNGQPAALATAAPAGGPAPLEVFFHGGDSSDPDGDPLNFTWHFGDGSASVRKRPSHIYSTPGVYSATLIVDDGSGEPNSADASAPLRIVAGNDPPDAAIVAPAAGARYQAGQAVTFEG